ncbi:hypothetical protein ACFLYF_04285, partial [Chloroflexota bacterium]
MAKKKANTRSKPRGISRQPKAPPKTKPGGKSFWGGLSRFLVSRAIRRFVLIVLFLAFLFWQWQNIVDGITDITVNTLGLFGWGLVLIALVIIVIVCAIWRRPLSAFIHRWKLHLWNIWLGIAAFVLAIWGILALFELGGSLGLSIIDYDPGIIGVLRILGLIVLGIILI